MTLAATRSYRFRAARADGAMESGRVAALNEEHATSVLAGRGLFPIQLSAEEQSAARRTGLPIGELALGLRILANLLDAGLPMTRTLRTFEELAPASWRTTLPHLREAVKEGASLANALATAPVEIPALVVGIARAGEAGNGLPAAVRRAAELMESAAATRAAIRSALVYPAVLATAGAASVGLLVGVVIPRFASLLADVGQALPPATRIVMHAANVTRVMFVPGVITIFVVTLVWFTWTSTPVGRERWHEWLLQLPVVGEIRRAAASARAAWALAALLQSGVPVADALRFAASSMGDGSLERRLLQARERVMAGASLGRAVEETGAMTPTAVRLARAGEESGRLPDLLGHAARIEQERSERIVRSAVRSLEPALILAFAMVIALVAAALLQAVYSVRPVP